MSIRRKIRNPFSFLNNMLGPVPAGSDVTLFWLGLVASILGLVFILDAGYVQSMNVNGSLIPAAFVSQVRSLVIGILAYAFIRKVRPEWLQKNAKLLVTVGFLLLVAVEIKGTTMNGAKRWLGPEKFAFQPAEFIKLITIIYLASVLCFKEEWHSTWETRRKKAGYFWQVIEPKVVRFWPALVVLVIWFLIERERDLGTATVVLATAVAMFLSVPKTKQSVATVGLILFVGLSFFVITQPYRLQRFTVHPVRWEKENINKDSYQTIHSELAMASGGVVGTGFGSGRAKYMLPATTTDFIMATVAEECGFWGPMICLIVVGGIAFRLLQKGYANEDKFKRLVLIGVGWWIAIQATTNMMMANATIPAIGIPFPFISAGGSSLIALWVTLAICERVSVAPELEKVEGKHALSHYRRRNRRSRLSRA
jgi:cell division protein FtsW